jgi:hypothetical protein
MLSTKIKFMKKICLLSIAVLLLFSNFIFAQSKKFRWETGLCEYEGTYDAKKHTAAQLKNTNRLVNEEFNLDTGNATVFKFEDIARQDFAVIEADYRKKTAELKSLDIVKIPYWENVRQKQLKELETYYLLSKATMGSYKTPESLRDYPNAPGCQTKYAEPLIAGGDALLKVWEIQNIEARKNNGFPEEVKRRFERERNSPDALSYARVEVTTFGWWNCANALIDQGDDYAVKEKNFRKLFIRTRTVICDEP